MRTRPAYVLERRQWLPLSLERTFGFFADAGNLARITPPWLGFRILTPPPVTMAQGLRLDYRVRVLGIPMRWRSLISVYEPPHAFRDVQLSGPYRRWEHTHRFREEDGGTLVHDRVVYELPLGLVGALVHAALVRRRLGQIFDYRQERIAALLLGAGVPVVGAESFRPRDGSEGTRVDGHDSQADRRHGADGVCRADAGPRPAGRRRVGDPRWRRGEPSSGPRPGS